MSQALCDDKSPSVVCVAFPGPVDRRGRVLVTPTIWRGDQAGAFGGATEFAQLWPDRHLSALASGRGALLSARRRATIEPEAFRRSQLGPRARGKATGFDSAKDGCVDLDQDWDGMVQLGRLDDDSGLIGSGFYLTRIRRSQRSTPGSLIQSRRPGS